MRIAYPSVRALPGAVAAFCLVLSTPAGAQCRLCEDAGPVIAQRGGNGRALRIDIDTGIDFARYVHLNDDEGYAELDPVTGERRTSGGLGELGGIAVTARVTLEGEPGRAVLVDFPDHITLHAPGGDKLELTRLQTDLPAQPRLGSDGFLRFSVGGRITADRRDAGRFHGRIRVSARYE